METLRILKGSLCFCLFKSYYVVWKLTYRVPCPIGLSTFKSYYVVWKHIRFHRLTAFIVGLNRTMQYGNAIIAFSLFFIFARLNRTMQYGNFFSIKKYANTAPGLNRTMQYGNYIAEAREGIEFPRLNRTMQYGNLCSFL